MTIMNVLIIYASRHGTTEKCAQKIEQQICGNVTLYHLQRGDAEIDLSPYEVVIIGGSVHGGRVQPHITWFCKKHLEELQTKILGIFVCCMERGAEAKKQLHKSFPYELINNAQTVSIFGGELIWEKMNYFERYLAQKVACRQQNISLIWEENISRFIQKINTACVKN